MLFVGVAQEKAHVVTRGARPPLGIDGDPFRARTGPFFIKFCSYFPFNAKLCLNGHEYLKQQLAREGIGFEANGKDDRAQHYLRRWPGR